MQKPNLDTVPSEERRVISQLKAILPELEGKEFAFAERGHINWLLIEDIDLSKKQAVLENMLSYVAELPRLRSLILDNDNLSVLPDCFDLFPSLERLSLSKNRFMEFPEEILECKSLKILDISENKLTKLPEGISRLENLEHFVLSPQNLDHHLASL